MAGNALKTYADAYVSPAEETALRGEIIENTESLLELSKQQLAAKKAQITLQLDNRKLDAAMKIMQGMENLADCFTDPDIIDRVRSNVKSGMDMKMLADAFKSLSGELKTLSRPDMLDGQGTKKELKLGVQFGDTKVVMEIKE